MQVDSSYFPGIAPTSPPPYTAFPQRGPLTLSPPLRAPSPYIPSPMAYPHPGYGPTPLTVNQPLLPYAYYAPQDAADARARLRFFTAFVLAIGLWLFFGFAIGVGILAEEGWP